MSKPLSGKVAIVTGASSGIGRETAIQLADAGAMVVLAARREGLLAEAVKDIQDKGGEAAAVTTDVLDRSQVKALVTTATATFGPVDILVTSAGISYFTFMKNCLESHWETTVDINIKGMLNSIGAVIPDMISRGTGHIVNISSEDVKHGSSGLAVYAGTKSFVENVSNTMRREIQEKGVKITTIQPGWVDTPALDISVDKEADAIVANENKEEMLQPGDIARTIVFVVSQPKHVAINELLIQPTTLPN